MIFPRHGDEDHGAATMSGGMTMPSTAASGTTAAAETSSMTSSSSGSMMMMMMSVFQTDRSTPLYATAWTPKNAAGYAATILFLIGLGMVFRLLLAVKSVQEKRWLEQELNRRYVVVNPQGMGASHDSLAKQKMTLTVGGVEEDVMVVKKHTSSRRPWRITVDPVRAVIDTVIAGVGYLLMLAVMTMNVGYFLAVLGGTFLGSLAVGRYATHGEH